VKIITSLQEWQLLRTNVGIPPVAGRSIGFVPTMGALHPGHLSLVERSRTENETTVVSIFVNPTQFNNSTDFDKYPKTWDQDCAMLSAAGVDYLLAPDFANVYPDQFRFSVDEKEYSRVLEGAHRPGHFKGVLTVVMKLLNLVQPTCAYFGEKDYQQLKLIEDMVQAFFMRTSIIACPTIREQDGLAMSSRNLRLSDQDREKAPLFYRVLKSNTPIVEMKRQLEDAGFEIDYIEEYQGRRFGAAKLGDVRLIDNVEI
jgi:pantoate--beta-alanine ligase